MNEAKRKVVRWRTEQAVLRLELSYGAKLRGD